jgi:plasmid stabilization system protein ParE
LKPIKYHPAARREIKASHAWYDQRSADAADGFYEELLPAIDRVQRRPQLHPPYLYATQRAVFDRYPFSIVYREKPREIQIIAVAHAKRRPGYWMKRLLARITAIPATEIPLSA